MNVSADRDLVLRLQNNDDRAFDILYCKYHKAIYRNALKFTKDEEAALDILQEVFSTLWEKRYIINPDQAVSGWLFVISFNQSVNYTRRNLRENEAFSNLALMVEPDNEENLTIYQYQYYLIQKAVKQLSPQRQKVFTLCKLEGKSYDETAKLLNISKHTVKEYLSIGMASVKDYVKNHSNNWETTGMGALFFFLMS